MNDLRDLMIVLAVLVTPFVVEHIRRRIQRRKARVASLKEHDARAARDQAHQLVVEQEYQRRMAEYRQMDAERQADEAASAAMDARVRARSI